MSRVKEVYNYFKRRRKIVKEFRPCYAKSEGRIVFLGSPDYNNLGDQAIAYAMCEYVRKQFPSIPYLEFDQNQIFTDFQNVSKNISRNDIILLVGGGNLGDRYLDQRLLRNITVLLFPQNQIIIFPQTIDYSRSIKGFLCRRKNSKLFSKHSNLVMFAREKVSYEKMKRYFRRNTVYLAPDIVFSLGKRTSDHIKRSDKILFCFRKDREKRIKKKDVTRLKSIFKGYKTEDVDTVTNHAILPVAREKELLQIWENISSAKLVLTDRLHCMIFCAITDTPCIVFSNSNHKIKSSYEWISSLPYIAYCENVENAKKVYEEINSGSFADMNQDFSVLSQSLKTSFKYVKKEQTSL